MQITNKQFYLEDDREAKIFSGRLILPTEKWVEIIGIELPDEIYPEVLVEVETSPDFSLTRHERAGGGISTVCSTQSQWYFSFNVDVQNIEGDIEPMTIGTFNLGTHHVKLMFDPHIEA
jgi:hypothetical protein